MNYLTALLAFAAVMIVLSTLATVVVEGLHKIASKRSKDFQEMLTKLYDDTVQSRLPQNAGPETKASAAEEFAAQLTKNPAFRETNSGLLKHIPFLRNLFKTEFDQLTTRQFCRAIGSNGRRQTFADHTA